MKQPPRASANPAKRVAGAEKTVKAEGQTIDQPSTVSKPTASSQMEHFETAMKLFHERKFVEAAKEFEQAASGPGRDLAHSARVHLRMCRQRLAHSEPDLQTPEDHYHYAVGLLNQRRLEEAESHLRVAVEQRPNADYVHYALALCRGLQGDLAQAAQYLEQAIRIDPKNRIIARNDPDFLEFAKEPPVRDLVFADKKEPARG